MDRKTTLFLAASLAAPVLNSFSAQPPAILNAPAAKPESMQILKPSVKARPHATTGETVWLVPFVIKRGGPTSQGHLQISARWFGKPASNPHPALLSTQDQTSLLSLPVPPSAYFHGSAAISGPTSLAASGFFQFESCPASSKPGSPDCSTVESPLDLTVDLSPPASNNKMFYLPLLYALSGILAGFLMLLPKSFINFMSAIPSADFKWKIEEAWLANLNAASAVVANLTLLGFGPEALSASGPVKEYSAWSALYVTATGLSPTVFSLLKRVTVVQQANPTQSGTLIGFIAANSLNLFGIGGQLLFCHYALDYLTRSLQIDTTISNALQVALLLLALATIYYASTRFYLVSRSGSMSTASLATPSNNFML